MSPGRLTERSAVADMDREGDDDHVRHGVGHSRRAAWRVSAMTQPKAVGWKTVVVALMAVPVMIGTLMWMDAPPAAGQSAAQKAASSSPTGPDEQCRVEAPASARAEAQGLCDVGVFSLVNVRLDERRIVVMLQFSKKDMPLFVAGKGVFLNRFRSMVSGMAEDTRKDVAFSFHDPVGQMVGGCARGRKDSAATCSK